MLKIQMREVLLRELVVTMAIDHKIYDGNTSLSRVDSGSNQGRELVHMIPCT